LAENPQLPFLTFLVYYLKKLKQNAVDIVLVDFRGLVLVIFGLYSITTNVRKESLLMKALRSTPKKNLKCPSCGRKIPQQSYGHCPFCGHALKS